MKHLFATFVLFLLFISATPAFAALRVPGSVATTTPLQPIPSGTAPNYERNIDASGNGSVGNTDEAQTTQNTNSEAPAQTTTPRLVYSPPGNVAGKILLGLIFMLFGAFVIFKIFSRNGKK